MTYEGMLQEQSLLNFHLHLFFGTKEIVNSMNLIITRTIRVFLQTKEREAEKNDERKRRVRTSKVEKVGQHERRRKSQSRERANLSRVA
jgi:hypothetical protein